MAGRSVGSSYLPLALQVAIVTLFSGHLTVLSFNPVVAATSPGTPYNLTITEVSGRTASVRWRLYEGDGILGKDIRVTGFKMTIRPVTPELPVDIDGGAPLAVNQETVSKIGGARRSFHFEDLLPNTEYRVYLVAYSTEGPSNSSDTVTFTTVEGKSASQELNTTEICENNPSMSSFCQILVSLIFGLTRF